MQRRIWTYVLHIVVVLVVAAVAGCARAPDPAPKAELVWATGGITAGTPTKEIADRWNRLHPYGPTVRVEALPQAADDQRQLLALELNAGIEDFDILDLDMIWTAEFAENGWLVDLSELRPEIEKLTLPAPVQTAMWKDRLWAVPWNTDVGLLYYRSDLVTTPPRTLQEMLDAGFQAAATQGIAPFVADGAQYEGLVVQFFEYYWAAGGGDVLDADGTAARLDPERALHAVEFMRTAYRNGFYAPGFDSMKLEDARQTFQSGQAVFMRSWPYAYRLMNGADPTSQVIGKIGVAPLPTFDGSGSVAALGGHNLGVSAFSRNVPAATEFVRFVGTSPDVQRLLGEQPSAPPALRSTYDERTEDPLLGLLPTVLATAMPRPPTPAYPSISKEIQQQVFTAYTGGQEPRVAVDAMRRFLASITQER